MVAQPIKFVANNFLQRDFEDGQASITPMKMQKLVYCLHGWHLAITGAPAIDGQFEVWPYGPVEEELYHLFKQYRGANIDKYANSWTENGEAPFVVNRSNTQFYDILNAVSKKYMPMSALQLSALTHQPGTPWSITKERGETLIPDDLIQKHFTQIVQRT